MFIAVLTDFLRAQSVTVARTGYSRLATTLFKTLLSSLAQISMSFKEIEPTGGSRDGKRARKISERKRERERERGSKQKKKKGKTEIAIS